jgi:hypothetical protein
MKIKTDKDVFGYVKDIMREYRFDNILDIWFKFPSVGGVAETHRFNINNIEELVGKMFDFSLSKRVSAIHSFASNYDHVSAFEISLSESSDHQTNITLKMIEFFKLIVDPFSRDTLVEALKPKPPAMKDYLDWNGKFIIAPMVETNIWDYFEKDIYV